MAPCSHQSLRFESNHWVPDGYQQPSRETIQAALQIVEPAKKKQKKNEQTPDKHQTLKVTLPSAQTFPAPLVNEEDELYHDPDYPPQSLQDWLDEDARNEVTSKRRTIYVAPPPEIAGEVAFMKGWQASQSNRRDAAPSEADEPSVTGDDVAEAPAVEAVADYLRAFYHGLPVKVLQDPALRFARWNDGSKSKAKQQAVNAVALEAGEEAIRVGCRPSQDTVFKGQLNLNDLLDVAISVLPTDAYALLMLVNHDLYEDEEDDFCCGRAFGGSRVAVVSSARYRPDLDAKQNVDREHSWPASHCCVDIAGQVKTGERAGSKTKSALERYPQSAVAAGVAAFNTLTPASSPAQLSALWLGRVCKTASHELGHCFGIDHCNYYACIMQGTANIAEDSRQPPYLCPVDLSKVLRATGATEADQYDALLRVCKLWANDRMFAALAAWIEVRMRQMAAS